MDELSFLFPTHPLPDRDMKPLTHISLYLIILSISLPGCKDKPTAPPEDPEPPPPVVSQTQTGIQITTPVGTNHTLISIPEGPFQMGANNGIRNEGPEHTIYLKAYYIDHTEVTNAQWNPYAIAERQLPNFDPPEHPVVNINWFQADEYCKWLGGRLPTEAEWEKAARGTDGTDLSLGHCPRPQPRQLPQQRRPL